MSVAGSDVVAELDALQMDSHRSIERTCGRSFYPRPRQAAPMLPLATKAAAQAVAAPEVATPADAAAAAAVPLAAPERAAAPQ